MSELQRLLDVEVEKAKDAIRWEWQLDLNEYLWGSAYGPWRKPTYTGLTTILISDQE